MVVPNSRETLYCYTQVIHSYECCDIINISIIIMYWRRISVSNGKIVKDKFKYLKKNDGLIIVELLKLILRL